MAVSVGEKAPDFELTTDHEQSWRLSSHVGNVVVLLFYPQNETLVCTRQLCSVRDTWAEYLQTKAEIVGISPGTPDDHQTFSNRLELPIPLLADPGRQITRLFSEHWLYPLSFTRSVVVIDASGVVRNTDVMLSAFRPSDESIIRDIYAARTELLHNKFKAINSRLRRPNDNS